MWQVQKKYLLGRYSESKYILLYKEAVWNLVFRYFKKQWNTYVVIDTWINKSIKIFNDGQSPLIFIAPTWK